MSLDRPEINAKKTTNPTTATLLYGGVNDTAIIFHCAAAVVIISNTLVRRILLFLSIFGIIASHISQLPACRRALDFGIRSLSLAYPFSGMGDLLVEMTILD